MDAGGGAKQEARAEGGSLAVWKTELDPLFFE